MDIDVNEIGGELAVTLNVAFDMQYTLPLVSSERAQKLIHFSTVHLLD